MKSITFAALGVFGILVFLLLMLPPVTKRQMQATLLHVVSPVFRTGFSIQQRLRGVRGGLKRLNQLEQDNQRLRLENEQLRTANSLLKNLEVEVNRLNRALGFQQQSSFQLAPARIISRDNVTWWTTCTIDRGRRDGIAPDMAVVTESGLVGKVTTVSEDTAMVLLLSDESLRVSVSIEGTQEKGIISGTRASSNYTPDLRIRFLNRTAVLKPGMKVLTTGTGGVFPAGVMVGLVKSFSVKELEGVATVEPGVDLANVQDVFVIRGQK